MKGALLDLGDTLTSPSPPASHSHISSGRHFYVAVDRLQFKMETLVDLLGVAGRRPSLPMVICCSSRDELDAVCSAVSNLSFISLSPLYSDQAEAERASILERFRQASTRWTQTCNADPEVESGNVDSKSCMIVVTDACLPLAASGESPLMARVLINYELPTKKERLLVWDGFPADMLNFLQETYLRRMSTCLAADGIVINMVVGGEVVTLKGLEESSGLVIAEMPINISEIL